MPKWALYALPDCLKAERYEDIPTPREIAIAVTRGRLPWVERDGLGRYFFADTDIPKIAQALGLKEPPKPDQPAADALATGLAGLSAEFNKLFR